MPTIPGVKAADATNPAQTLEKLTSLIIEEGDTETPEPVAATPTPSVPEPPPESSDTEPDADKYEVTVDGEVEIVDLDELKRGYSRDKDYRHKTMAHADDVRAFETEKQSVFKERQEYVDGLKQIHEALQQLTGEPDWDALRKDLSPADFLERKADWEHQRLNVQKLKDKQEEVSRKQQEEQTKQWQAMVRSEQDKLLAAIPEWSEPDARKAEFLKIVQVAKQYGYTEAEVTSVVDHRAMRVLRDAMKYRELHREPTPATKAKVSPIKAAKPGTPDRPRPNAAQQKLIEQTKSGRQRDAMRAIEAMLD